MFVSSDLKTECACKLPGRCYTPPLPPSHDHPQQILGLPKRKLSVHSQFFADVRKQHPKAMVLVRVSSAGLTGRTRLSTFGFGLGHCARTRRRDPTPACCCYAPTHASSALNLHLQPAPCFWQVGKFYEAQGTDAVLLVQYAGLNPMGDPNPPRAGCPKENLRQTWDLLRAAGLTVAVCEEVRLHTLR